MGSIIYKNTPILEKSSQNLGTKTNIALFQSPSAWECGVDTDYLSQECIREGFAYSNHKPSSEKIGKKNIHTTYDAVYNYSPEVCGINISATAFKNPNK